jgi:7-cyano-7-deazaguanine reductase
VADDVIRTVDPRRLKVEAEWFVRGGIGTTVVVEHARKA